FPVLLFLAFLALVACWRSLARSGRRHVVFNNLATFGRIALSVAGCVLVLYGAFFGPVCGRLLMEATQNIGGAPWYVSVRSPNTIRLTGELTYGVTDAFKKTLANNPSVSQIELDSPGGYVTEGLAIAALVEQHSLSTLVKHKCASACTDIF